MFPEKYCLDKDGTYLKIFFDLIGGLYDPCVLATA